MVHATSYLTRQNGIHSQATCRQHLLPGKLFRIATKHALCAGAAAGTALHQQAPAAGLHLYLQPTSPPPAKEENAAPRLRTGWWRRATEYCNYGNVRFKLRKFKNNDKWTFLDVRLQGGTLFIPRLRVDGTTWTVLRNLMALEELTPGNKPVTAYCFFMSQVASNVEDVELLQRQKILEHFLVNDEEVAQGFANLCKGLVLDVDNDDSNYLKPYWHELHTLCNHSRNFRNKYCTDPMYHQLASIIVSGILFLFALAQVILAIPWVQKRLQ